MRLTRGVVCASLLGMLAFGLTGGARAATLTLSCELLSGGSTGSCATAPMYTVPGQYNYVQSFSSPTGSTAISGSNIYAGSTYGSLGSAGFIDDYAFQITPAQADVVTATINLAGAYSIGNLFARIYSLASNPGGEVLTTPAGPVDYGTIVTSGAATEVVINPVMLTAGSYVLEITGTASGSLGGSYTGTLNLNAVPLPPALTLLLSGLGALGVLLAGRRRLVSAAA
ncbi:MAG: FxDxF family PEP-CTERM protein [Steroidobacteraceae bacterium]